MKSTYLKTIENSIGKAASVRDKLVLTVKRAIYLARTGDLVQSRGEILRVRAEYGISYDDEIYCWIWVAEAVLSFFEGKMSVEKGALKRAAIIAQAAGRAEVYRNSCAWLALFDFNDCNYRGAVDNVVRTDFNRPGAPEATLRALLVLADSFQHAGFSSQADRYYSQARDVAAETGDRASLIAAVENRASLSLGHLWFSSFFEEVRLDDLQGLDNQLANGLALEKATGTEVLFFHGNIWKTRVLVLRGEYELALREALVAAESVPEPLESISLSNLANVAWLACKCGDEQTARKYYNSALEKIFTEFDLDDRAVMLMQLSDVAALLNSNTRGVDFVGLAKAAYDGHNLLVCELREYLKLVRAEDFQSLE